MIKKVMCIRADNRGCFFHKQTKYSHILFCTLFGQKSETVAYGHANLRRLNK